MTIKKIKILLMLLGFSLPLFAATPSTHTANINAPIAIQADSLQYDHQTGVVTHQGHVIVTQADKTLKANTLFIYRDAKNKSNPVSKLIAKGTTNQAATFTGKLKDNKTSIEAQAQTISYFPQTQILTLEGNALLKKENDTFKSPVIHFNLSSSVVTATKDEKTRPTLVIYEYKK